MTMERISITKDVSLSEITLGACNPDLESTNTVMEKYLQHGGSSFDTGRAYFDGAYDVFLGQWIRSRNLRNQVQICMKGCLPANPDKMYISRLGKADIKGDLEASLIGAGLDYTDIYLLHRDDVTLPVEEMVIAMNELLQEGKTRTIGVSNWTGARIAQANAFAKENNLTPFAVSQVHFGLGDTTSAATGDITHVPMNDVEYNWYLSNDFPVMAFSSQAKGFFGRMETNTELNKQQKAYYSFFPRNYERGKRAIELGRKYKVSASAIALAYVLAQTLKTSAMVGFTSVAQFDESIKALEVQLSKEEINYLESGI